MTTSIKDRAVLVKFTDRVWIAGTIDKKVGRDIERAHGATTNCGHYWLRLVPKAALRERTNLGSDARSFHYANTLPWMESGIRILPAANFDAYMREMRKRKAAADAAVAKFVGQYKSWVDEAKRVQGSLFNGAHYPNEAELRSKFGFELDIIPIPNVSDWRVDLADDQVTELKREAEAKFAAVQREGITEMFERLQAVLEHAKAKLDDPKAIFRDSLVGNIKELVGLLGRLNVTGDANLENIRKETEEKFKDAGPMELRTNPERRAKAAKDAAAIMSKMAAYMGRKDVPAIAATATTEAPRKRVLTAEQRDAKNKKARERRSAKKNGG